MCAWMFMLIKCETGAVIRMVYKYKRLVREMVYFYYMSLYAVKQQNLPLAYTIECCRLASI